MYDKFNILNKSCIAKLNEIPHVTIPDFKQKITTDYQHTSTDPHLKFNDYVDNMPSLFYFLDGFINENVGDILDNIKTYLIVNKLLPNDKVEYVINGSSDYGIKLNLLNQKELNIKYNDLINDTQIYKLFNDVHYMITHVASDKHATSLLLYTINNVMYCMSFNSGSGIELHELHEIKNNNMYLPYIGFIICEDVTKKDKLKDASDYYIKILVFNNFYNFLCELPNIDLTMTLINQIKIPYDIITKDFTSDQKTKFNNQFVFNINGVSKSFNDLFDYTKADLANKKLNVIINSKYYNLVHDFFYSTKTKFDIDKIISSKLDIYDKKNVDIHNKNEIYKKIPADIQNKNNLHFYNNKLYIYEQQSGSCTWFSIYWPLLFYHIIHSRDINNYISLFNKICETAYKYVTTIFKYEYFVKEYSLDKSYYNFMVNICHKLVNLNVLDKSYLNSVDDIIYDISFDIPNKETPNETITINNMLIDKEIYKIMLDLIKTKNTTQIITDLIHIMIKPSPNNNYYLKLNTLIIILWELFINNINIYKNVPINNYNLKTLHALYNLQKQSNIIIDNYNNILTKKVKSPIYIIKYYHLIMYLYDFYKENVQNFKINMSLDDILINFSEILYKFETINNLFYFIHFMTGFTTAPRPTLPNYKKIIVDYVLQIFIIDAITINITDIDMIDSYNIMNNYVLDIFKMNESYDISIITKFNSINLNVLYNFNMFLLKNPKIMFESINQPNVINGFFDDIFYKTSYISNFIQMNIFIIFKNDEIRNILLRYFCEKYFNAHNIIQTHNNDICKKFKLIICKHVQILIQKYANFKDYITDEFYSIYDSRNRPGSHMCNFLGIETMYTINDVYDKLELLLTKYTKSSNFCNYVIENQYIFKPNKIVEVLLNKYFNNIKKENNILFIDNIRFDNIQLKETHFLKKTFCSNIIHTILCSHDNSIIYVLSFDFILKINLIKDGSMYKINNIEYNNNHVIKYKDIIAPFRYIIPRNFIYLIYKSNNIYYVTYFINSKLEPKKNNMLMPVNIIQSSITISINSHNLFYPNKMTINELQHFQSLLLNGGINNFNSFYIKPDKEYGAYINDKFYNIVYNDINIISPHVNDKYDTININFLNNTNQHPIVTLKKTNSLIVEQMKHEYSIAKLDSLNNLLFKISKCVINFNKKERDFINNKLTDIIGKSNDLIYDLTNEINKSRIDRLYHLFDSKYEYMYKYLSYLKISNICKDLLKIPNYELCSNIKIYNEQLKIKKYKYVYGFEKLFEFFFGNEISDEQYDRYIQILNSYKKFNNNSLYEKKIKNNTSEKIDVFNYINQIGGNAEYPLHHFMMGKGKSAVITPLLTLYFTLIEKKIVFIIIPDHLKLQTIDTICTYACIFNLKLHTNTNESIDDSNIIITTDSEIKQLFLDGYFTDIHKNENIIFLMDEFDNMIDPLKSNYNIIIDQNVKTDTNIINLIKYVNDSIKNDGKVNYDTLKIKFAGISSIDLILNEIRLIINQLYTLQLKENINWGIHPTKCYAIPYLNKDKPLLKSNFSSCILTLFLTFYYYINLKNYQLTQNLYNYVKDNRLQEELFNVDNDKYISFYDMEKYVKQIQEYFFKVIFDKIIKSIQLSDEQYNTSFIDIINISKIFKIGYSGTVNIDIPNIDVTFMEPVSDADEEINVKYAILKSNIINIPFDNNNLLDTYLNDPQIKKYSALIDACGLFKNYDNNDVAQKLHNVLNRPIIFLNNIDEKLVIDKKQVKKYNENITYKNPFIYYSQSHIIGIDIKQDKYPNIHGLCIIDNYSVYTQIAQAIFRLRKLNMGHKIDFNLIKIENINNVNDLYTFLKQKDTEARNNKKKLLLFQTLKSSIRKRHESAIFKDKYKEKIKYYFNDGMNTSNILENILDISKMNSEEEQIHKSIENDLIQMVYNYNSFEINTQQEQEQEQEQKREQVHVDFKMDICNLYIRFNIYIDEQMFFKDNFLDNLQIKVDDIYILRNTFTYRYIADGEIYQSVDKLKSKNDYMFILYKKQLILINSVMLQYVFNKYPILNLNLSLINREYFRITSQYEQILKDLYDNSKILKILNYKNRDDTLLLGLNYNIQFIIFLIFQTYNIENMSLNQYNYYKQINSYCQFIDIPNTIKQMII